MSQVSPHQEAMCDEDMPAVFQYFTQVSSLPPNPPSRPPSPPVLLSLCHSSFPLRQEALCDEETGGGLDPKDPNRPRFTLQELRDVLHERNELKAKVFMLQEELAYYKRCACVDLRGRAAADLMLMILVFALAVKRQKMTP